MKLLMRQKVFSWTDRFLVWDELGRERYTVEGELFSWGKRLHVCDPAGRETLYLEEKLFSLLKIKTGLRHRLYGNAAPFFLSCITVFPRPRNPGQ